MEKLQRDDEQEERLFERHLDQKEEKEKNELDEVHRSEMKKGKNQRMAQNERQRLAVHHSDQRNQLEREQRQAHEMELRKWKRRRLICKLLIFANHIYCNSKFQQNTTRSKKCLRRRCKRNYSGQKKKTS